MKKSIIYFLSLILLFISTSCSESGGQQLEELINGNYDLILLQDNSGDLWAIPVVNINSFHKDKLTIKTKTIVAKGKWNADKNNIPKYPIDMEFVYTSGDTNADISLEGEWKPKNNKSIYDGCVELLINMVLDYNPIETSFKSFNFANGYGKLVFIQEQTEIIVSTVIDKIKRQQKLSF